MRHQLIGSVVGIGGILGLSAAMLPLRSHLAIATAALVLVVPVIAGAITGGFTGGLVSVVAGFLAYDLFFVPPYGTLTVGNSQNWLALTVYVIVMVLVARIVSNLHRARDVSRSREANARHLLDLSELLLADKPLADLGSSIVSAIRKDFGIDSAVLLVAVSGQLEVVASSGAPFSEEELARLRPEAHLPVPLSTGLSHDVVQTLALVSSGRPVGLLVLRTVPPDRAVREVLPILANHLAIALERAQLRERLLRTDLLEEIDRLRRSLVGAVSHDLRTPLATIKVASSTLLEKGASLSPDDADELHRLIDLQTDRLTRLVHSLLDMTRIQSGSLEVRRQSRSVRDLIDEAIAELHAILDGRLVEIRIADDVPPVEVDEQLVVQVLANLLDNANRHAPDRRPISVEATKGSDGRVSIAVTDEGPGVPPSEREAVFEEFVRFDTGGRSGLGLAIARAFVEAHGECIWVEAGPKGGARFVFTMAPAVADRPR